MKKDIAIIGAGLSAAVLSHELLKAGHTVTVYEKSRGTGGRMASCRLGKHSANLGTPYINAKSDEFKHWLSRQEGILTKDLTVSDFSSITSGQQQVFVHPDRLSMLTRGLFKGATLITQSRVGYIWPETQRVILRDTQGSLLSNHDAAVVTAPPKQAEPLLEAVPRFARIAEATEASVCWVQVIEVDKTEVNTDLFTGEHPVLSRMVKQGCFQDSEIWFIEANSQWSKDHQDTPSEEVREALLMSFQQVLNTSVSVRESRTHRWLYSRIINPEHSVLWSEDNSIGACGDWLGNGELEGAWKSAVSLAAALNSGHQTPI